MSGFNPDDLRSIADDVDDEERRRLERGQGNLSFGVEFLDKIFEGIHKHDLVLIGARTGAGKTEIITNIAFENALNGKKVYVLALEAEPSEITSRLRFKVLTKLFYEGGGTKPVNYKAWLAGRLSKDFAPYYEAASSLLKSLTNLVVYYRKQVFNLRTFVSLANYVSADADLIICDHIHYFDHETDNENRELTEATKTMKDLVQHNGIPIIVVGHLRKMNKADRSAVPAIEDFHGSSNLGKICTKAFVMASGGPKERKSDQFITYFRICKNRSFGASASYIGETVFDLRSNSYSKKFFLCRLTPDETQVLRVAEGEMPSWLKEAQ